MKKVLVTGGAGFVGHHVIEAILRQTDAEVVSLDRLDTSGTLFRLQHVLQENPEWSSRLTVVWHDLKASLNDFAVKALGDVTHVLHLAAGSHVDRSIDCPMEFVMDNVVDIDLVIRMLLQKLGLKNCACLMKIPTTCQLLLPTL